MIRHSLEAFDAFHYPATDQHLLCPVASRAHIIADATPRPLLPHTEERSSSSGLGVALHPLSPAIPAPCPSPILVFSDVTVYAFGAAQERDDAAEAMESYNVVHDTPLLYWETGSDELIDRDEWVCLLCDFHKDCLGNHINSAYYKGRGDRNFVNCEIVCRDGQGIRNFLRGESVYRLPVVEVWATRVILPGSELFVDYGDDYKSPLKPPRKK